MSEGRVAGLVELVSVIEKSALTTRGGRENTRPFLSAMLLNRSVGGSICAGGSMFDVIEASDYQICIMPEKGSLLLTHPVVFYSRISTHGGLTVCG